MGEILDVKKVSYLTTLSPTTIQRMVKKGDFPRPLQISPNRIAWSSVEVEEWILSRPEAKKMVGK